MHNPYLADSTATESSTDWQTWPNVEYPGIIFLSVLLAFTQRTLQEHVRIQILRGWMGSEIVVLPIPCNLKANLICAKVKHLKAISTSS